EVGDGVDVGADVQGKVVALGVRRDHLDRRARLPTDAAVGAPGDSADAVPAHDGLQHVAPAAAGAALRRAAPLAPAPPAHPPAAHTVEEGIAWITLNRPAVLNALDTELAAALADHAEAAAADPAVALVVVRGAGRAFCSGMDRTALAAREIGEAFYRHWIRGLNRLEDMSKISIAVLH